MVAAAESASKTLAKKPAAKAKAKPKAKAVAHLVEDDLILTTATELEQLSKEAAFKMVGELAENVDYTYFRLGGVLSVIQSHSWFVDEGYDTFRSFVETEYGINYRKAMYLVAIYNGLVESGVKWETVQDIGWSKLKELAGIIEPKTVAKWVKAAKSMTVMQLIEYIKEEQKGSLDKGADGKESTAASTVSSMTFKVHGDQKEVINEAIEKAKGEADTEYPTVALEAICMSFLSSGKKAKPTKQKSVEKQMEELGWEEVLNRFEALWPDINVSVEV